MGSWIGQIGGVILGVAETIVGSLLFCSVGIVNDI